MKKWIRNNKNEIIVMIAILEIIIFSFGGFYMITLIIGS